MAKEMKAKRRGRPPLRQGGAKRASFNTRVTDDLKRKLEAAAHFAGRSLSEEIERRLDLSVREQQTLVDSLGGHQAVRLFLKLAQIAEMPGREKWLHDLATFNAVMGQWQLVLDEWAPKRFPEKPPDIEEVKAAYERYQASPMSHADTRAFLEISLRPFLASAPKTEDSQS